MPEVIFSTLENYFDDYHPHVLIYGYNGTGKTTLAGKTGMRTVLLDCRDSGLATLRKVDPQFLRVVRINSIFHYLDAIAKATQNAAKIDLLVVDTLSGLRSIAVREVKPKRSFDMNIKKWGQVSSRLIECIHETRNFPNDVIYLAQETKKGVLGEDGPKFITPSLSDGVREFMSGYVDWVGRTYIEDGKRKLSFILSDTMEAKDRGDTFPKVITLSGGPDKSPYPMIRERIIKSIKGEK